MATPSDEDKAFQQATQNISDEDAAFQPLTGGPKTLQQGFGIPTIPGKQSTPTTFDNIWDKAIDFIRPFVGTGTGIALAAPTATASGPAAFVGGVAGDVGGYTLADTMMQYLKVHQPDNLQEAMNTAARDAVVNTVGGGIANSVVKGGMAFRSAGIPEIYKLFPTTSQALEHFGIKILPSIAKAFEDIGAPGAKAAAQAMSGGEAGIQALELSNLMNGKPPGSLVNADPQRLLDAIKTRLKSGINPSAQPNQFQTPLHYVSKDLLDDIQAGTDPFEVLRDKLSNDKELDKFLSIGKAGGNPDVKEDLQAFNFSDLFKRATKSMTPTATGQVRARIDPELFAQEWFAPSRQTTLTKLYGAQQKQTLDGFINRVLTTQDNPLVPAKVAYVGNGFTLSGALATLLSGHPGPAGTAAAIYVPIGAMSRALTNTKFAKAISAYMGAEPVPQALSIGGKEQLGKAIVDGLQGLRYAFVSPDGKKTWQSPIAGTKIGQPQSEQ